VILPDRGSKGRIIQVRAVPNSRKKGLLGFEGGVLKIGLGAPPQDGRANEELIGFLSDHMNVKRSAIKIIRGATSRNKTVLIEESK
jgi:uncharacterized protein (TIGR00251 family)